MNSHTCTYANLNKYAIKFREILWKLKVFGFQCS